MLTHLDLFSGIGGFALAAQWAGVKTIGFVEIDKYCQQVLKKHWPDVPIVGDINNVEEIKQIVANATGKRKRIGQQERVDREVYAPPGREQGGDSTKPCDSLLLTGGFPCQPFSQAGRRKGSADNRYLWPQTLAVIEAVKPDWIVLENVAGLLSMVFPDSEVGVASQASLFGDTDEEICDYDTICGRIESDLQKAGYETVWFVIPACAVSTPHRRDRVWIVADSCTEGLQGGKPKQPVRLLRQPDRSGGNERPNWSENWYEVATCFCRVDDGVSNRVDRLKSLGNAIVPQVAYQILKEIAEIETVNHGMV